MASVRTHRSDEEPCFLMQKIIGKVVEDAVFGGWKTPAMIPDELLLEVLARSGKTQTPTKPTN